MALRTLPEFRISQAPDPWARDTEGGAAIALQGLGQLQRSNEFGKLNEFRSAEALSKPGFLLDADGNVTFSPEKFQIDMAKLNQMNVDFEINKEKVMFPQKQRQALGTTAMTGALSGQPGYSFAAKEAIPLETEQFAMPKTLQPPFQLPSAAGDVRIRPEVIATEAAKERELATRETESKIAKNIRTSTGITPYQRSQLISRGAKVGLTPEQFIADDGNFDLDMFAGEIGKAERVMELADAQTKANQVPAETKNKILGMQAAREQLYSLQDELKAMSLKSEQPGAFDSAIAAAIREPSSSFFGALYQSGLKAMQSDDSKKLEGAKAMVSASVIRALSGLAQTLPEIANSSAFRPTETDSFPMVLEKAKRLEDYINREIKGYTTPMGQPSATRPDQDASNSPEGRSVEAVSRSGKPIIKGPDGKWHYKD